MKSNLQKLKDELAEFVRPIYFRFLPIAEIREIVRKHGWDDSNFDGVWCGRVGRVQVPIDGGTAENHEHGVVVSWYKMDVSGKFELTCYAY